MRYLTIALLVLLPSCISTGPHAGKIDPVAYATAVAAIDEAEAIGFGYWEATIKRLPPEEQAVELEKL